MSIDLTPEQLAHSLAAARRIAAEAHTNQVDAAGAPYAGHLNRVAARAEALRSVHARDLEPAIVQAIATLHDVIEDTEVTAQDLLDAGVPAAVVDDVMLLTHQHGEPRSVYLERVATSRAAAIVKLADSRDNADPRRMALVEKADPQRAVRLRRKYANDEQVLLAALD